MKIRKLAVASLLASCVAGSAWANDIKVGFVDMHRIFRDAPIAQKVSKRLESEFSKRDRELQAMAQQLRTLQDGLARNATTLSESDLRLKEREVAELTRELQRRQREFREDLNQRRNEELAGVLERANRTIKQIAEADKYDIIFQEAVYASPRIDITDKVIKALSEASK